jgi:hypothetical protein
MTINGELIAACNYDPERGGYMFYGLNALPVVFVPSVEFKLTGNVSQRWQKLEQIFDDKAIRNQLENYKKYCYLNGLKPSDYNNLKKYTKENK